MTENADENSVSELGIMFYYSPPKSSVWGHSLGKMPAERARMLFNQFLHTAVAEYVQSASVMRQNFRTLTQEQFEQCFKEVIEESASDKFSKLALSQSFDISKWRIDRQLVATNSNIKMHYGGTPCISTFLQFETIDQFQYIKEVFENLGLCKLDEKHLKVWKVKRNEHLTKPS